ncbi:hypothetical protein DRN74_03035 [Candidatus Micrarchaeota archaeon]|nr:MAG: hypothetical protein DRN74_03035 [Candidatus Micrarchaeota archaeon]
MPSLKWAIIITFFILSLMLSAIFWLAMFFFRVTGPTLVLSTFAFVAFMIFFQWLVGPSVIKMTARLRPCEDKKILHMVEKISRKTGIPMPDVYIADSRIPNAFAFGRTQSSSAIALHKGLIDSLNDSELEAVIAHEIGHIKHRDVIVMTLASALPLILYYLIYFGSLFASSRDNRGTVNYLGAWLGASVAHFLGTLIVLYLSRVREYYADEHSALVTKRPDSLISALRKISQGIRSSPVPRRAGREDILRTFYIENPAMELSGSSLMELLMTHPPLEKRIKALEKIKRKLL